jgi:hypothetical protein
MPAGLNINSALTFQGNSATNLLSAGFNSQSSPLSLGTYPLNLYVSGGNLYYNSSSTQIQLTTPTGVNATSSGISSGTASASFVSGVLVVDEAANTPANIQAGSYLLGNNTAGSDFITIAPAGTIAANYTFGLPLAPPSATSVVQMNSSGTLSANNTLPTGIITATQIANNTITNTQLAANNSVTSSVISFSTTSFSNVEVCAVTITTSGRRVRMSLLSSSGAVQSLLTVGSSAVTTMGFNTSFLVGSTFGSATQLGGYQTICYAPVNTTIAPAPPSSYYYEYAPTAGTYTFYFAVAATTGSTTISINNTVMVVEEI